MKTAPALIGLFCVFSTATLVLLCVVPVLFRRLRGWQIDTRRWRHNSMCAEWSPTEETYRWSRTTCHYFQRTPSGWREFDVNRVVLFEGDAIYRHDEISEGSTEEGTTCES